jgi:SOS-response transcriptional repressor LexA
VVDFTGLTPRQQEIYGFIREKLKSRGYGPTVREIGNAFEIVSPNGVMCHLSALLKKGLILRQGRSARAIQVVDDHTQPEVVRLTNENEQLKEQVAQLKDEAAVRESYIDTLINQTYCPECQRNRSEWY